jgi:hypothetical protein
MSWTIWRARNDFIFRQINPSFQQSKEHFSHELQMLLLRAKKSYSPRLNQWIANLI